MHPRVSVVIPTYNREATVRSSIESVLGQTFGDFELIVVDDCSTDHTVEVVKEIDDARICVIEKDANSGPADTRNVGVQRASGAWVAFQDSDDLWLPWKLERQMSRLEGDDQRYVAAYCGLLILGGLGADEQRGGRLKVAYVPRPSIESVNGDILTTLLGTNVISTQTLIVRREVLVGLGGFDVRTNGLEDWDCAIGLASTGPIAFVDEPLVFQRFSPNSITRDAALRVQSTVAVVEKHHEVFARHPALLARQLYAIAGAYRQAGDLGEARRYLAEARRLRPLAPRFAAMSTAVAAMSLLRRGRTAR